jgi:hypothetical protein
MAEALQLHEVQQLVAFGCLRIFSPNATLSRTVMCLNAA